MLFGFDVTTLGIIFVAVIIGGIFKGIVGLGLPIVSIAILLNFLPPTTVLAVIVVPIVVTNFWQAVRAGFDLAIVRRFWLMILTFLLFFISTTYFVVGFDPRVMFGILGTCVTIFAASNLVRPRAHPLSPQTERWAGPLAGALGGLLGGVSAVWGPPMIMYFVLIQLPKDVLIRSIGLIWFAGSVPLVLGYWSNGILNTQTLPLSIYACLPGLIGLWVGGRLRDHINQETFRKVMLVVLFLIGLNLIRRAVF